MESNMLKKIYELSTAGSDWTELIEKGYGTLKGKPTVPLSNNFFHQTIFYTDDSVFEMGYAIPRLEYDRTNEWKKKIREGIHISKCGGCLILHKVAIAALKNYLEPAGRFFDVEAPVPDYVGYFVTHRLKDAVDMEESKYTIYENGALVFNGYGMYMKHHMVAEHPIFMVYEDKVSIYVNETFKKAVEDSGLNGFRFIEFTRLT